MRSCTTPAGRPESHQRGCWIEALELCPGDLLSKSSNFSRKRWWGGQPSVNDRRVGGKHNTIKQTLVLWGRCSGNSRGNPWSLITSLHFVRLPSAWPCHGWDSSRWPPAHNGVITHLEPDILECEVKYTLGSITTNKASGGDGISVQFQILKDDAVKVLHPICQQIWKIQQWPQD